MSDYVTGRGETLPTDEQYRETAEAMYDSGVVFGDEDRGHMQVAEKNERGAYVQAVCVWVPAEAVERWIRDNE